MESGLQALWGEHAGTGVHEESTEVFYLFHSLHFLMCVHFIMTMQASFHGKSKVAIRAVV